MNRAVLAIVALLCCSCSRASSPAITPIATLPGLVEADFEAEVARSPMPVLPGGVEVGVGCCAYQGIAGAPVHASIDLILSPPDDAPSSPRPTTSLGEGYTIDAKSDPPRILRRPDFAAVRRAAPDAAKSALAAYAIAHGKLVTLAGYTAWRREGPTTYATTFQRDTRHPDRWTFYFRPLVPAGRTIVVDVDTATRAVIHVGTM